VRGRRFDNKTPSPYPRTARVNKVLREVVADALERLADVDDRLRLATVTSIDTSRDLRHATVYLSSLSDEAAEALSDPAVAHGLRVEDILRRIGGAPGASADDGPAGDDDTG
jgi:ribosome-binding factor A